MKKISLILLIVFMAGCSAPLGDSAISNKPELKVPKEKIIDSKQIVIPGITYTATSTHEIITEPSKIIVEYSYPSEVEAVKETLNIGKERYEEDISKRTINSQHFKIKETATSTKYIAIIRADWLFYGSDKKWYKIESATTTLDNYEEKTKPTVFDWIFGKRVLATTYQSYSEMGIKVLDAATWAAAHDATSGTVQGQFNDSYINSSLLSSLYYVGRTFYTYDTSSIGSGSTISAATFNLVIEKSADSQSRSYNIYDSTHTDVPVAGDYDLGGTTAYATAISHASINGNGTTYNSWSLNATGMSAINVTGKTKFVLREASVDVANAAPTVNGLTYLYIYNSNNAGTSKDPYMTITYSSSAVSPVNGDGLIFE